MELRLWCLVLLGAAAARAAAGLDNSGRSDVRTASIYIQPVVPQQQQKAAPAPSLLAEIRYDALDLAQAEVAAYEAPSDDEGDDVSEGEEDTRLYRIGAYDPKAGRWLSATSVAAAANFAKGYRPHLVLTVGGSSSSSRSSTGGGDRPLVSAALRGLPIDAGTTRDFAPKATVVEAAQGATPVLNRPVVLTPEGKKAAPPEERTFLQKYWWLIGIVVVLVATGGGGDPPK